MTEQYFSTTASSRSSPSRCRSRATAPPRDVAQAALFLASDQSSYLTGVALPVDGGFLAEKSFVSGQGSSAFLSGNETRDDRPGGQRPPATSRMLPVQ